jgi:hypothetical protein
MLAGRLWTVLLRQLQAHKTMTQHEHRGWAALLRCCCWGWCVLSSGSLLLCG